MFISVDGKAKKVTDIFAGMADGKAHRITELFGSVNGVAKQVYTIEKETNAFDQFTWAEIKQLANEGKLLEHFNQFDKVVIKLKEPLRQSVYMGTEGTIDLVQSEMMFQIAEVTETKMRLMCPRASALYGSSDLTISNKSIDATNKWYYFATSFEAGGTAYSNVKHGWGLSTAYDRLKALDNAFPDDFRDVLSVVARPLISWTKNSITGGDLITYDEDMRVTQVSDDIFKKGSTDVSNPNIVMPVIAQSYYPTSVAEFTYYISLPPELDTYEMRRKLTKSFGYLKLFDFTGKRVEVSLRNYEYRVKRTYLDSPYASCYFGKGITTNAEYTAYNSAGVSKNDYSYNLSTAFGIFPEVVIEADSE